MLPGGRWDSWSGSNRAALVSARGSQRVEVSMPHMMQMRPSKSSMLLTVIDPASERSPTPKTTENIRERE